MSQKFQFEGNFMTADQIKKIKARRLEEAKKAEKEAQEAKDKDNKPVSKMNKEELEKALTEFEVDFSKAKNNDDLKALLNEYLESTPDDSEPKNTTEENK